MQTTLKLLAKDGIIQMSFTPQLSPQQYSTVMSMVRVASTRNDIREIVERWAVDEGLAVTFEME